MASRALDDLAPPAAAAAERLLDGASRDGLDLLVYCTFRDLEEQARLYRNGRSLAKIQAKADDLAKRGRPDLGSLLIEVGPQYGRRIVTNAAPGESAHNYGYALDAVPLRGGKPVWSADEEEDLELWLRYGELAEDSGLAWAGRWTHFREYPHSQYPGIDINTLLYPEAAS